MCSRTGGTRKHWEKITGLGQAEGDASLPGTPAQLSASHGLHRDKNSSPKSGKNPRNNRIPRKTQLRE